MFVWGGIAGFCRQHRSATSRLTHCGIQGTEDLVTFERTSSPGIDRRETPPATRYVRQGCAFGATTRLCIPLGTVPGDSRGLLSVTAGHRWERLPGGLSFGMASRAMADACLVMPNDA